jgi:hypothetical protein
MWMRLAWPVVVLSLLAGAAVACGDEKGGAPATPSTQAATGTPAQRTATPAATGTASPPPAATTATVGGGTPSTGGGTVAGATVSSTPPPTLPAVGTATPTPAGDDVVVTRADDGRSVKVRVGQTFLVQLGEDMIWTVEIADQSIVSRVLGIAVIRGAQGVYRANRAGTTELTAAGDPPCRSATPPCAAPSVLIRVTLVVKP